MPHERNQASSRLTIAMITSTQNDRVRYIRSLARRRVRQREGRFVVEGTRLVDEATRAGVEPAFVLYTESWAATTDGERLLPALAACGDGAWPASEKVLASCADTKTPQGVLAVMPFLRIPPGPGLILILDQLRDPGNLGTILRSAEAARTGHVLLTPGTVDPYNPKVVRGAMGAHFRLSISCLDWPAIAQQVSGRTVWQAEMSGSMAHDAVDWTQPAALIVGGETTGASAEAAELATGWVRIPMAGEAESLNAAMAATVLLFEADRQQRAHAHRQSLH